MRAGAPGSEVKSLRAGRVTLADAYARVEGGEAWLLGVHIPPYEHAAGFGAHDPERRRKLLLHRDQIDELMGQTQQKALTLVPLSIYFKDGRAKVELALAQGRRLLRQAPRHRHAATRSATPSARRLAAGKSVGRGAPQGIRRTTRLAGSHLGGMIGRQPQGVIGFDFGRRCGRSEPWSPEPR